MKIYVGNLDPTITSDQLRQTFSAYGTVNSADVVTDKFSGASRGFGFVEMGDAEASAAIKALDGSPLGSNSLRVNEARPKEAGGGRFGGGGNRFGGGGGRPGGGGGRGRGAGGGGGRRNY